MSDDVVSRQLGYAALSIALGFVVAFIAGGWIVLLRPPIVKAPVPYWAFLLYWLDVAAAVRCLLYLCYERFVNQHRGRQ